MTLGARLSVVSDRLFLALVALLPLHTVYLHGWVSWKAWLILVVTVAALDLWRRRGWPWDRRVTLGIAVFLIAVIASWPGPGAPITFWRLLFALGAGGLLLLVTAGHIGDLDRVLRVVFWSGAALAATGLILGLITNGVFGADMVDRVNHLPGVDRVNKPAYIVGFVALTNWHQDPGYAALWTNVWFVLAAHAWLHGAVTGPKWLGMAVLGGLATASVLTLSRTGWVGLAVAAGAVVIWGGDRRRAVRLLVSAGAVCILLLGANWAVDPEGVGNDVSTSVWFRIVNLVVLGEVRVDDDQVVPGLDPGDNRLDVWSEYWDRFLGSPLRGTGLGTGWSELEFQEPHSLWLQLLAETGVVGMAGFVVLLMIVYRVARRPRRAVASALLVVAVATLTQTVLFEPVLWFVLGLWLARREERQEAVA